MIVIIYHMTVHCDKTNLSQYSGLVTVTQITH